MHFFAGVDDEGQAEPQLVAPLVFRTCEYRPAPPHGRATLGARIRPLRSLPAAGAAGVGDAVAAYDKGEDPPALQSDRQRVQCESHDSAGQHGPRLPPASDSHAGAWNTVGFCAVFFWVRNDPLPRQARDNTI